MEGWPQAPCQFWNTCAWQSMIMGTCGRTREASVCTAARPRECGDPGPRVRSLDSRWSLCSGQPKAGPECGNQRKNASRPAELLHVMLEQPLDLAIDGEVAAVEIHEALPLGIAIAD